MSNDERDRVTPGGSVAEMIIDNLGNVMSRAGVASDAAHGFRA